MNKTNMITKLFSPLALLFTVATTAGIVLHDTQVDRATTVALALPATIMGYAAVDMGIKSSDAHVHVERFSGVNHLRSTTPRLQPRDDDRRYFSSKRVSFSGSDTVGIWPSI